MWIHLRLFNQNSHFFNIDFQYANNILSTKDNLFKRCIVLSNYCEICSKVDDVTHRLLECNANMYIWLIYTNIIKIITRLH